MAEAVSPSLIGEPSQKLYSHPSQAGTSVTTPVSDGWSTWYQHRPQSTDEDVYKLKQLEKQHQDLYTQYQHLLGAYNQCRKILESEHRARQSLELAFNMERQVQEKKESRCQILQGTVIAYESESPADQKYTDLLAIIVKLSSMLQVQALNDSKGRGTIEEQ